MRDIASDRRKPETLSDLCDDGDGAVGGHRQRPGDLVSACDRLDGVEICEVDDLRRIGDAESRCLGVPVDRDDAEPALARLEDRPSLVAAGADEEDGRHGAMLTAGTTEAWESIGSGSARTRVPPVRVAWLGYEPWGGGRRPEKRRVDMSLADKGRRRRSGPRRAAGSAPQAPPAGRSERTRDQRSI